MNIFKDKIAIITGGASGIGKALCEELGRRGSTVIVADINGKGAMDVADEINASGGHAEGRFLDVTCCIEVNSLIETTVKDYGKLDYIFNNAGICIGGEMRDIEMQHWQRVMDINFHGVLYGTVSAYRIMIDQGYGHIINIASMGGLVPMPFNAPYCATKHAVVGMSLSLQAEAAILGIKVSVVCPGFVNTGIFEAMTMIGLDKEKMLSTMPFKRLPKPDEAARYIIRSIERGKTIIVFPLSARILWRMVRFFPAAARMVGAKIAGRFSKFRY